MDILPEETMVGGVIMRNFDGILYPDHMLKDTETVNSIRDAVVGDEDILVATYPKSGTAWALRILALIKNNADVEKTDAVPLFYTHKMLEFDHIADVLAQPEPRVIKTHMLYEHLPVNFRQRKNKIIYIARNPKDVCVSFYFHGKMVHGTDLDETFEEYFERFMTGKVAYGSWSEHMQNYWKHINDENMLWLTYEDLKKNSKKTISEICRFLGKELTEEQIEIVAKESSFETMKSKPSADYGKYLPVFDQSRSKYMRKGVVGDWKNYFTPEMSQRFDNMLEREITPLGVRICME